MTATDSDPGREILIHRLRSRRDELEKRLGRIQNDRRRSGGALDPDFAEQVPVRENDEVLDALDEVERRELASVRAALRRIEAACFGICDDCGGDIDPLRLEAHPSADLCLGCAQSHEAAATQS